MALHQADVYTLTERVLCVGNSVEVKRASENAIHVPLLFVALKTSFFVSSVALCVLAPAMVVGPQYV